LSRTYLVHARLSEDIDLIALGNRGEIARRLVSSIDAAQRRTHGRPEWPLPFGTRDTASAVVETHRGLDPSAVAR
jgi:hypothetical protein